MLFLLFDKLSSLDQNKIGLSTTCVLPILFGLHIDEIRKKNFIKII